MISALLAGRRFGFDVERAIYLTVLHRLMVVGLGSPCQPMAPWLPHSRRRTADARSRLPRDGLARRGDRPTAATTTDAIEEALYRHRQELFGEVSIAFFDTTSLYFEGAGGETLGQLGHSKDYRAHLKQVVLGIVLDGDDRPFASFLWPGNTADVTRLHAGGRSGCASASASPGSASSPIAA